MAAGEGKGKGGWTKGVPDFGCCEVGWGVEAAACACRGVPAGSSVGSAGPQISLDRDFESPARPNQPGTPLESQSGVGLVVFGVSVEVGALD